MVVLINYPHFPRISFLSTAKTRSNNNLLVVFRESLLIAHGSLKITFYLFLDLWVILTVKQAAARHGKSENSLYIAIREGRLAAEKDRNGNLFIEEEDIDYYCQEFKFPEFSPLTCLIKCLGLTQYSVMNDVDSGKLIAFKRHRTWFVEIDVWHHYLWVIGISITDQIDTKQSSSSMFRIKNAEGLSTEVGLFFCKEVKANRKNLIYVHGRGRTWLHSGDRSLIFLLDMEIFHGLEVGVKVYGENSQNTLDGIIDAANNKFEVVDLSEIT